MSNQLQSYQEVYERESNEILGAAAEIRKNGEAVEAAIGNILATSAKAARRENADDVDNLLC